MSVAVSAETTQKASQGIRANDRLVRLGKALSGRWRMVPILIALALVWVYFSFASDVFLSYRNLSFLSVQIVVTAMIGLALLLLLVLGEIDLPPLALPPWPRRLPRGLPSTDMGVPVAVLAAIATGCVVGLVQGLVVILTRAPSFIVSLGMSLALSGVLLALLPPTGLVSLVNEPLADLTITYLPHWVGYSLAAAATILVLLLRLHSYREKRRHSLKTRWLVDIGFPTAAVAIAGFVVVAVLNQFRGVPTPVAILLGMLVVFSYVATQTRFGLYIYAIGTNAEAAPRRHRGRTGPPRDLHASA